MTELDVDVLPRRGGGADVTDIEKQGVNPYRAGCRPTWPRSRPLLRQVMAPSCTNPARSTRITFWGTHDGTSWLNDFPVRGRTNHALLFDRQLQPKPAFRPCWTRWPRRDRGRPAHQGTPATPHPEQGRGNVPDPGSPMTAEAPGEADSPTGCGCPSPLLLVAKPPNPSGKAKPDDESIPATT